MATFQVVNYKLCHNCGTHLIYKNLYFGEAEMILEVLFLFELPGFIETDTERVVVNENSHTLICLLHGLYLAVIHRV
jgi:hypothetical protein